jgi:hypothetical protein
VKGVQREGSGVFETERRWSPAPRVIADRERNHECQAGSNRRMSGIARDYGAARIII